MPVVGNQEIGAGGNGYIHEFVIIRVGCNELPLVVGFLKIGALGAVVSTSCTCCAVRTE